MDLTPYVEALQTDLGTAAAAGTEQAQATAQLLAVVLEPAVRLCLVDALSAMAAEVTAAGDAVVEIRMHGRDPQVVVTAAEPITFPRPADPPPPASPSAATGEDEEDRGTARITLRLPDPLKAQVEQQAAAEGLSANAWLVRAVAAALRPSPRTAPIDRGRRLTGFARG